MRLLYLDWPHLPLRLEAARSPAASSELVVLGGQPWEPGVVLDCSHGAARLGVHRGQALGAAHNLVPEATFLAADRPAYAAAFEAAIEAIAPFTPALEGETDPDQRAFGQAFVGIEGLERLWGDEPTLVGRIVGALAPMLPGRPRAGIGNTRFGAQVAAVVGDRPSRRDHPDGHSSVEAIAPGGPEIEAAFLAPLPIRLLPADATTHDRFRLFGLTRIGEFAALARSAVLARFGAAGGDLHDLARGLDGRPLRPRRPIERLRADAELDPPVDELGPLRFVLHHLCGALCAQLSARGAGASRATLTLALERAAPLRIEQVLPEPAAVPELLERLLLARLEAAPPGAPVERLILELDGTAPAAGQQLGLFTPQLARAARLDWQLAGLAIRFGSDRLLEARIADPEALLAQDRFDLRPAVAESRSTAASTLP
jgi:nucleotidyltransferase/DNA polymerase involved in DNA repair